MWVRLFRYGKREEAIANWRGQIIIQRASGKICWGKMVILGVKDRSIRTASRWGINQKIGKKKGENG